MHRRSSKKKELIKRIAVYALMTLMVLFIVTGLVFVTLGYRLDTDNGRIEQGALLQFDTVPAGATIEIDGVAISPKTPGKKSIIAGTHTFAMWREGYETWHKTLDIKAGTLTWLNYARLVPKVRTVDPVAQYATLHSSLAATDGRNMLIQQDGTQPTFQRVNLESDDIKSTTLTVPTALYADASTVGVTHDFKIIEWDDGGRYVLIQHTYNDKNEWLILDSHDASATKNVTTLLDLDISSAKLSGTSGNVLYALSGGDIRKLDLSAGTISRSLVTHVNSFELFDTNTVTYVGTNPDDVTKRVVGLYRDGDSAPHILRSVTSAPEVPLHVTTARYFNQDYVAISEGNRVDIISGDYPASGSDDKSSLTAYGSFNFPQGVGRLVFSPAGDYLLVQSGTTFTSYDIEHQKVAKSAVASDETNTVGILKWLDDSYVWSDYGDSVTMREFDGTNSNVINQAATGQDVVLSENGRYLYSIGRTDTGFQLQRVRMILP